MSIQGVAGAGKSSVLKPEGQVLGEDGKEIIGLAVQNTLVQMLERDTGIRSMTLARLLKSWAPLLEHPGNPGLMDEARARSEEHTSELQSLMRISYAVFCLKKKMNHTRQRVQVTNRQYKTLHIQLQHASQ